MKMKRVAMVLAAMLTAVSILGCGSSDSGQTQAKTEPATQAQQAGTAAQTEAKEPQGEVETVELWCWDEAFNVYAMKEAAKLYEAQRPNVKIDVQNITDNITVRFTSAITSQQMELLPDIMLIQDRDLEKYVELYDVFEDLTDSGINFSDFAGYKVEAASANGKNYGIPFDNGVACYVYRSDLLEQAGYKAEDITDITWREFIDIGVAVKEKLGIPMAKVRTDAGFTLIEMMMQSAGSWYFDENGELNLTDNAVFREALDLYLEMVEKGIVVEVTDGEQYSSAFYDGSVMGTVNASWVLATVSKEESLSGKWSITNVPKLVNAPGATNFSSSGGCNWTIIKTSEHKEAALNFLKETVGGGSLAGEFFDTVLKGAAVVSSYLPATESETYKAGTDYYGGQPVYYDLVNYSAGVPRISLGWYTTEARTALATCVQQIHSGTDIEKALEDMKSTLEFQMVK